jgi:dihydroorotate dehydrogenase (NAD+) catalytic subunit
MRTSSTDLYDPNKTFDDNFDHGPYPSKLDSSISSAPTTKSYSFLGHKVHIPFGIPAGPLPTSRHIDYAFYKGFDVVCYKTQRSVIFPANAFPNIVYLDVDGDLTLDKAAHPIIGHLAANKPANQLTITNSFGNPSRGPAYWTEDIKQALATQKDGQLLIISIVGTIKEGFSATEYYEDFADTAQLAVDAGAKIIEVNLSCPNVATEGILCYSADAVTNICKLIKERIGEVSLVAKLGYFSREQQQTLEQIVEDNKQYVSAYSVINTIPVPVVNELGDQLLSGAGRLKSGACGASIKWAGLEMVKKLANLRDKHNYGYEIIGVGGVMNVADFLEYRAAGASIVQSATGSMWNPNLAIEISNYLNR